MKTILALCLSAWLAVPAAAQEKRPLVTVVPFVVLDSRPDCAGKGKIPFRVAFDQKDAKARFGFADQKPPEVCEIVNRRGGDYTKVRVPCSDAVTRPAPNLSLAEFPTKADLTGEVVACLSVDRIAILQASWTLSAETPLGMLTTQGNMSNPGMTVIVTGPQSGFAKSTSWNNRTKYPYVVFMWDGVDTGLQTDAGDAIKISTYHAVLAAEFGGDACTGDACAPTDVDALYMIQSFGELPARNLVDFVEGK
ncbi:MAG: hypothetical protein WAT09_08410 [Paracoccaceae bacterium]